MPSNLSKILTSVGTLWYGIIPIAADLNDSHLLKPDWMPHAKFHLAWLLAMGSCLAAYAFYLIWRKAQVIEAASIGVCVMGGFWIAAFTKSFYGGLFVDPNVEAPSILGLHPNVFAFIFVTGFLGAGLLTELFKKPDNDIALK